MHLSLIARAAIFTPIVYLAIFAFVRLVGKRTLSNMNAIDLLVTVAVGSTIPMVVLTPGVTFWVGVIALAIPLALQVGVVWIASHSESAEKIVKSHPALLLYDGEVNHRIMEHEMITEDEVREAVRKAGLPSLEDARAVVLEVDGNLSVISREKEVHDDEKSTLRGIRKRLEKKD